MFATPRDALTLVEAPIARGLTPHGLRHSHRTNMEDLRTETVLMDERLGHLDGSVSAR